MQNRPLRRFEQGAHLHVLDWTHGTVRQRFQEAGHIQVKAATKTVVNGKVDGPPQMPALEAALHAELRKLYAVGHATVRSELDHQASGDPLPIGLSQAPAPPNLRQAKGAKRRCGTCKMFDNGSCWGYGNVGVEPDELCDAWAPEVKTLAVADPAPDRSQLAARAALVAQHVAHQIYQAVQRGRLQGITSSRALKQAGRQAGHDALASEASRHAGGAINAGRRAGATTGQAQIVGARYTSVLDKNTCGPCAEADTGQLIPLDSPEWIPTPNPACLGGDRCRCIHVYALSTEGLPTRPAEPADRSPLPPDDFPREPRQPDRPTGPVAHIPVAQVGPGGS